MIAVDLDGDGDMDLLSISITDDRVLWYENLLFESTTTPAIAASTTSPVAPSSTSPVSPGNSSPATPGTTSPVAPSRESGAIGKKRNVAAVMCHARTCLRFLRSSMFIVCRAATQPQRWPALARQPQSHLITAMALNLHHKVRSITFCAMLNTT